jgi:hypothetical protein
MSKMCGDTARFHRIRKHRTRMRAQVRELRAAIEKAAGREDPQSYSSGPKARRTLPAIPPLRA